MEYLDKVQFTHRYWIIVLPLVMMAADIITGWIQASVNGVWDSTKMRQGLFRKSGELLVLILAYVVSIAISLPLDVPAFFAIYIVIMEVLSVAENLDKAGLPVPRWITKRLGKVAKVMTEEDLLGGDETEDKQTADKQEPYSEETSKNAD